MHSSEALGRRATLGVARLAPQGAYLSLGDGRDVLLPRGELAAPLREGDLVDVFVYLDSEDRPIATRAAPKLELGEVAFLEVKDVTSFGAFVDWGLPKDLLVPLKEQTRALRAGERHPIGLYLDDTGRLAGTMRVAEMLRARPVADQEQWVTGEAWRNEPEIGLFVIVNRRWVGLVPAGEPHTLERGESARFRVANVLPDGKVELSLRGPAHHELASDAEAILETLARLGTRKVGDRSSPEEIRALFGLSKKAFKRAVGRLLKEGRVTLDSRGFIVPNR